MQRRRFSVKTGSLHSLKMGAFRLTIAKQVRFIDLGKEATPTQAHFNFVEVFIPRHYPARIAKVGDLYQLAATNGHRARLKRSSRLMSMP